MSYIDLRSDTVTRPDAGMIEAMASAEVGDDVYGEDATVNILEEKVAGLLGKERALFVPTGVMSNQLCLKVLTSPGDEVIVGESSHIFNYETGAPALLSGVQLHTIPDRGGMMDLDDIDEAVREEAYYLPRTSVIALEQTHNREGGSIIPMDRIEAIAATARSKGLNLHLDGARIWNASAASGIAPGEYAAHFDTVSVCLSKGLGAPVGSVMAGSARHVEMARKFRKIWGGGWRQAGILAAGGLYALRHNVERLADDHRNAARFAELLRDAPNVKVINTPRTNIVLFSIDGIATGEFVERLRARGVLVSAAFKGKLRAVFHKDVSAEQTEAAAVALRETARPAYSGLAG
jgi:threonine aldolase